jgi:Flp pilus assembly protein TadD
MAARTPEAICDEALALHQAGRRDEARRLYQKVLLRDPRHLKALHLLGTLWAELGEHVRAIELLRRSIRIDPKVPGAYVIMGAALSALGRREEALTSFDAAMALSPNDAGIHHKRGVSLTQLGRHEEALESYERAVTIDPDHAEALAARAYTLLLTGRLEEGWRAYEHRKAGPSTMHPKDGRAWLGDADPTGKRLLVYGEYGLGDVVQFARYLPRLIGTGAQAMFLGPRTLMSLVADMAPGVEILDEAEPLPAFDYHCALLSLPLALGATKDIPPPAPLRADPQRVARIAALLGPKTRRRIGIAWSGNPAHLDDHNRSIPFERLAPLLTHDADWIALQNDIRSSDATAFARDGRVRFFGEALGDFSDAAALADQMDLVISVDTSLAHLAGALEKPVGILLPFVPDWRWLLGRDNSPWYPTARLFRQPAPGDWASVIEAVSSSLEAARGRVA